jgi:5'/3'-nucleotidase SurE
VGGAREGTFCGIPALAISLVARGEADFTPAAHIAARLVRLVLEQGLPERTLLNVNVPLGKPERAVITVQDYRFAVSQYAQASLRDVIGSMTLDELLSERDQIQSKIASVVESRASTWGTHIDSIRLLDIDMPEDLKRMMSRQASAEREKRATITKAEGDRDAALNLAAAAATMSASPGAMQLRTLQTLDGLGSSPSNTVVIAVPVEVLELAKALARARGGS